MKYCIRGIIEICSQEKNHKNYITDIPNHQTKHSSMDIHKKHTE